MQLSTAQKLELTNQSKMSMIFEISTFKLAKICSKILNTKKIIFFFRAVYSVSLSPHYYQKQPPKVFCKKKVFLEISQNS